MDNLKSHYDRKGYVGPFTAFERNELDQMGIVSLIASLDKTRGWARNRHLDIPVIAKLCRNEVIVSCVRAVLGPNLLLWRSNIFAIRSNGIGLGWHQDTYRTLLDCPPGAANCSAQINFTDSTRLNSVSIIPETHRLSDEDLRERAYRMKRGSDEGAYGTPNWEIPSDAGVVDLPMMAGQFYVFHPRLLHASVRARWFRGTADPRSLMPWLKQRLLSKYERWSRQSPIRYSITLRIATPDTKVLPAAFVEVPARATSVLFAGTDTSG
ncbi:MAG: hypothetical protein AUG75_23475, partial [Cyanobacteria bacterium 13_1_20CM_4_61_6]